MKRALVSALVILAVAVIAASCSLLTTVSRDELQPIIQRDGVPFVMGSIPDVVIDRLASNRVVVVGELHFLREHRELLAELLRKLHARGFRQYLFEWTQAADWLLDDYVNDGGLMPDWTPPHDIGEVTLTAIRDLNRMLPEGERIQVHAIDVHLPDYGGTQGWVGILGLVTRYLPEPGPLATFLQGDHDSFEGHRDLLQALQAELTGQRSTLVGSWGDRWYSTVVEMVEVELKSVAVRAIRESDYDESVRLHEEAIKWLADRRIASTPAGTLINFGSTHAQKEGLWGTKNIEWLGDYLVHKSPATKGSVFALWVPAAGIVSAPGSDVPDSELGASPKNELLRLMNQAWPDQSVFLPLDDPLFSSGRIRINSAGDLYASAPARHYDAVLLLPLAHRDFVGD